MYTCIHQQYLSNKYIIFNIATLVSLFFSDDLKADVSGLFLFALHSVRIITYNKTVFTIFQQSRGSNRVWTGTCRYIEVEKMIKAEALWSFAFRKNTL